MDVPNNRIAYAKSLALDCICAKRVQADLQCLKTPCILVAGCFNIPTNLPRSSFDAKECRKRLHGILVDRVIAMAPP